MGEDMKSISKHGRIAAFTAGAVLGATLLSSPAEATNGYVSNG